MIHIAYNEVQGSKKKFVNMQGIEENITSSQLKFQTISRKSEFDDICDFKRCKSIYLGISACFDFVRQNIEDFSREKLFTVQSFEKQFTLRSISTIDDFVVKKRCPVNKFMSMASNPAECSNTNGSFLIIVK